MDNKWIISIQSWWSNLDYIIKQNMLHPWKLTWNLNITQLKRKVIFKTSIFRFHVIDPSALGSLGQRYLPCGARGLKAVTHLGVSAGRFRSPVLLKLVRYMENIYCSTMLHPRKIHMEPKNWWFGSMFLLFQGGYFWNHIQRWKILLMETIPNNHLACIKVCK